MRRPRLSRRRVKALVRIGQVWTDGDGTGWSVRQIHYKDGLVELVFVVGPVATGRWPTFSELGRHYRPEESL